MAEPEPNPEPNPDPDPTPDPKAAAPDPTPDPEPTPAPEPTPDPVGWRDPITDEDTRKFADRFNSVADMAKAGLKFQQQVSNSITKPSKDASDEDVAVYYKSLGRPDEPDGYEFTRPDDLPDWLAPTDESKANEIAIVTAMHGAGATPEVVQAGINAYYLEQKRVGEEAAAAVNKSMEAAVTAQRAKWGADYDENLRIAQNALKTYGGDELVAWLEETGGGDHPALLGAFATIGRQMGEDGMIHTTIGDDKRQTLEQREREIMETLIDDRTQAQENELKEIRKQLYGTGEATNRVAA
ncbi:hypothetical protein LCGC14_2663150 [marine sediment metagenome]|uniref:Uncharacterized protein n=1 Tax=marine sediment metagenome TaxID=412755 RepID=A0A0F9CIB7_9ZZZZ